jgi:NAD(P)-dependent dehydrogenase (short-subunit alcohol dehydrogenase family)
MRLKDKIAIVTGASSGIGRATALLFAREGARLVLAARGRQALHQVALEIAASGGHAQACAGDVRDEGFARELVAQAERWGGLDVAFNNAGTIAGMGPSTGLALADWNESIEVNLTSAFVHAKHQLAAMQRRGAGSLIFTSSFVGHTAAFPQTAAYAASKAGLVGLTQALANEFGPQGIRVNALLPGGTDTPMARQMNGSPEAMAHVASLHALKRIAQPEEIARAALFLACDDASFVTGSAMLADGGVSVCRA